MTISAIAGRHHLPQPTHTIDGGYRFDDTGMGGDDLQAVHRARPVVAVPPVIAVHFAE